MYSLYQAEKHAAPSSQIRLAELLGALSHALDMTEGQPEGHCVRCCWIGTQIGLKLGMEAEELSDLYFTLLLKDLGCSSNAARICELYLTDDISFKRDFKTIDDNLGSALRFVFAKTGLGSGLSERFRALVQIMQNGGEITRELIETRCDQGAKIARKMRFSDRVQEGIRALDEHWDGSGKPQGRREAQIPIISNIALLAQVIDIFNTERGTKAAIDEAKARSGTWFDPKIIAAFLKLESDREFWRILGSADIETHVFEMEPAKQSETVDADFLDEIAEAFADVVDAKSSFTADHSRRVTLYSDMIAEQMNLTPGHRRWLRRAALLHDLGKLAVSNQILDKPDRLSDEEFEIVKTHPAHSARILQKISVFADIAPIAGAHHERLDGAGYPNGLGEEALCLEARILTVADVFDALTADRPYRPAMKIEKALGILEKDAGSAFDGSCVRALKKALVQLDAAAA